MAPNTPQLPGALVISLDFELRWGVRDHYGLDGGAYRDNLLGARTAIPRMLDLFEEFGISATWATVGMLMAGTRDELERFSPAERPKYANSALDAYGEPIGDEEVSDPLHFAPSLIEQIRIRRGQEIASHTFGHYYPLELGADAESFRADLTSAVAIAQANGIALHSLVFPRNQFNPRFAGIIEEAGFTSCRSNPASWMYRQADSASYFRPHVRMGRLIDNYAPLSGSQVVRWDEVPFIGSLCCLPASHFLRPFTPKLRHLDPLRFRRIAGGITEAARTGGLFHLWWHPHNAGVHTDGYLDFLRHIFEEFVDCRERYGMQSLSMCGATELARSLTRAGSRLPS